MATVTSFPLETTLFGRDLIVQYAHPNSPLYYDGTGDGTTDDSAKFAEAESDHASIYLDAGKTFNLDTTYPAKPVYGPGTIKVSGTDMTGFQPVVTVRKRVISFTPPSPPSPQDSGTHLSVAIGHAIAGLIGGDISLASTGVFRTTVIGTQALQQPVSIERCEIIGNGAAFYSEYMARTVAIGSIAAQWVGVTDPDASNHNYWRRPDGSGGYYAPGDVGWDAGAIGGFGSLEGDNPGIGADILSFSASNVPDHQDDNEQNIIIGRDACNNTLKVNNSVVIGYTAGGNSVNCAGNVYIGSYAQNRGVFVSNSVAIGYQAAIRWQEGTRNVVIGQGAGQAAITGSYSVLLGTFAGVNMTQIGDPTTDGSGCVFIGYRAGAGLTTPNTTPTNLLVIANNQLSSRRPLIIGDFSVGCVAINGIRTDITDGLWKVFNTSGTLRFSVTDTGLDLPTSSAPGSPASTNIWRTSGDLGSDITGGTVTLDPRDIAMNYYTNNGNHALSVASVDGVSVCLITNGSTPGTVNLSVFNFQDPGNDPIDNVPGNKFLVIVSRVNTHKTIWIRAQQ